MYSSPDTELTPDRFVDFAMHRVRMLQHFGVIPYLVFDGDYLPSKAATETDREKRREESRRTGLELLSAGKTSQAHLELQKAVDVTPEMARQLIDELKKVNVQYIVAPYEADAQIVYLERKGIVDGILSEDSDLLVFGAKCLLTKLDQYGNCIEINKADFCACKEVSLTGWSDTEFRRMAILSGCDYLASINNMGLKTAYRMIRRHKTIEKVLRMLSFDGKFRIPKGYLEDFYRAELTFLHQRVFCPATLQLVFHTEPPTPIADEQMPFIGAYVEPKIAQGVARGDLNPMTKLPIISGSHETMPPPVTPWAASRSQQQVQRLGSNDPKKGKPIDTFFKPKRVPLAELDINCFTPSPVQQNALQRNSGPWLATPSPRPYLNRAATEPQQAPRSAPLPTATRASNSTRTHSRTPTISEPRPLKRVRLCEELDIDPVIPGQQIQLGRSRFFGESTAEPSPTMNKKSKARRSKKEDIAIFSDDSIDDALLSLPDFDGFSNDIAKPKGKLALFEDSQDKHEPVGNPLPAASASTCEPSSEQIKPPPLTPSVSASSSEEQPPTPDQTIARPATGGKFVEKFSYVPIYTPSATSTPKSHSQPTPPSSAVPKPSRIPLAVKPATVPIKSSLASRQPGMTPLQRLGATAANRSKLPMTLPMTPSSSSNIASKKRVAYPSMLSTRSVPFPEVLKDMSMTGPAAVPLPLPDDAENRALLMQEGSEDMIIPDSEDEVDGVDDRPHGLAPRMGLEKFAYTAREFEQK